MEGRNNRECVCAVVYGGASVTVPVTVIESLVEKIDIIENNYVYIKTTVRSPLP